MTPELDRLAYGIIGAAIEVHRVLGPGFLESVYEEALALELTARQLPHTRQAALAVQYKGAAVGHARVDLIVAETVIVELKTIERFAPIHTAQAISYLKASGLHLALLINFNVLSLRNGVKRIALDARTAAERR